MKKGPVMAPYSGFKELGNSTEPCGARSSFAFLTVPTTLAESRRTHDCCLLDAFGFAENSNELEKFADYPEFCAQNSSELKEFAVTSFLVSSTTYMG